MKRQKFHKLMPIQNLSLALISAFKCNLSDPLIDMKLGKRSTALNSSQSTENGVIIRQSTENVIKFSIFFIDGMWKVERPPYLYRNSAWDLNCKESRSTDVRVEEVNRLVCVVVISNGRFWSERLVETFELLNWIQSESLICEDRKWQITVSKFK